MLPLTKRIPEDLFSPLSIKSIGFVKSFLLRLHSDRLVVVLVECINEFYLCTNIHAYLVKISLEVLAQRFVLYCLLLSVSRHLGSAGSPVLGYLAAGVLIGPYALSIIKNIHGTRMIAEFGVVFLLFNIGLEVLMLSFLKVCTMFK